MRFFLPGETDAKRADVIYTTIAAGCGANPKLRRIYRLDYRHAERLMIAEVGKQPDAYYQVADPILVIVETAGCYAIVTAVRGVLSSTPIYAGMIDSVPTFFET